jgi:Fic/DOC family
VITSERAVLKYIAEEVDRQQDRPLAVWWMSQAWQLAQQHASTRADVTPMLIESWGRLVTPKNSEGFRRVNVTVGGRICPPPALVPRMVENLCVSIADGLLEDAAYYEFQKIHPFVDGNGRTGKILYNYIRRTLDRPAMPPNFFGCSNP